MPAQADSVTVNALSALPNAANVVNVYSQAKEHGGIVSQAVAVAIEVAAPLLQQAVLDGALSPDEALQEWNEIAYELQRLAK